jgi:FkbM family methyltransferase
MPKSPLVFRLVHRVAAGLGYQLEKYPPPETLEGDLKLLLERGKVDAVLDVGAFDGCYHQRLRQIGYQGQIFSFEPVASWFQKIEEASKTDPKWEVFNLALGDEEKETAINVSNVSSFSSLLPKTKYCLEEFPRLTKDMGQQPIPMRRLDVILRELTAKHPIRSIFLKVDTQGYDLHVLRGAGEWIHRFAGVQVELPIKHLYEGVPDMKDFLTELEGMGLDVVGIYPVAHDEKFRLVEADCLLQNTAVVTTSAANR